MNKTILFLTDGMADEPMPELGDKTPMEYAHTPNMDRIAKLGASGTLLTLPDGYPTSSDVANMSVLGYDLATCYTGRGPLEAVSQGIELAPNDIAWRCNLINVSDNGILMDYSGGHLEQHASEQLIAALQAEFGGERLTFHPGVSYRNLIVTHSPEFSTAIAYEKPDASQGKPLSDIMLKPSDDSPEAAFTANFLNDISNRSREFLKAQPANAGKDHMANMIWPWSPGKKPAMEPFSTKYGGARGAVISAVDVIFGLGICADMTIIRVEGATGYIDTNYEGKADAAVKALADHDFVYLHVEAADETSHMGEIDLKLKVIEDIDKRLVGRVLEQLEGQTITYGVAPDHPVPLRLRDHTRTPVPLAICGPHITPDHCDAYSEQQAVTGTIGALKGDGFMKALLNL